MALFCCGHTIAQPTLHAHKRNAQKHYSGITVWTLSRTTCSDRSGPTLSGDGPRFGAQDPSYRTDVRILGRVGRGEGPYSTSVRYGSAGSAGSNIRSVWAVSNICSVCGQGADAVAAPLRVRCRLNYCSGRYLHRSDVDRATTDVKRAVSHTTARRPLATAPSRARSPIPSDCPKYKSVSK